MEFEIKRDIVTSMVGELGEILENDMNLGKFWFRLSINGCIDIDQLYLHLLSIGLLDYQAKKLCVDLGECINDRGEQLAEVCGIAEGGVMSFVVSASTESELEEKTTFFVQSVVKIKEAASNCLLQAVPSWTKKEKEILIGFLFVFLVPNITMQTFIGRTCYHLVNFI